MSRTIILKNEPENQCKPRPQTVQNILNFSKAYSVKKLKDDFIFETVVN